MYLDRTNYAVIENGQVVEYPVCPIIIDPVTCHSNLPVNWDGGVFEGKQYVFCHNIEPDCDYMHNLVEGTPVLNQANGLWYRHYDVVPATPEEIQQRSDARAQGLLNAVQREVAQVQEDQAYIASLSQEQQDDWAAFLQQIQNLHLQEGFPWIGFPQRPQHTNPEITVERI